MSTLKSVINDQTRINEYGGTNATLFDNFLSKSIKEYGRIFRLLHEKVEV